MLNIPPKTQKSAPIIHCLTQTSCHTLMISYGVRCWPFQERADLCVFVCVFVSVLMPESKRSYKMDKLNSEHESWTWKVNKICTFCQLTGAEIHLKTLVKRLVHCGPKCVSFFVWLEDEVCCNTGRPHVEGFQNRTHNLVFKNKKCQYLAK